MLNADTRALLEEKVVETVHTFGQGLVGVLSRPRDGSSSGVALVLLNAGLVQRSGPFRLYAQLARALCNLGFTVFRFDQSGLGDSPVSTVAASGRKQAEVVAAMDLVTRQTGIASFVLGGLCSGADDAFNIGPAQPRVAGIMLLDGVAYQTTGFRLRHYLPRILNPAKVARAIMRVLRRAPCGSGGGVDPGNFREFPSNADAIKTLEGLVARNANVLLLYTGGVDRYFNHARQAGECFGAVMRSPRISMEYWPDCDHTFYLKQHRDRLVELVSSWLQAGFQTGR